VAQRFELVGLLKVNGCCLFTWREPEMGGQRSVEIRPEHCALCVAELAKIGPGWTRIDLREAAASLPTRSLSQG
jgi:hypothetical protein